MFKYSYLYYNKAEQSLLDLPWDEHVTKFQLTVQQSYPQDQDNEQTSGSKIPHTYTHIL